MRHCERFKILPVVLRVTTRYYKRFKGAMRDVMFLKELCF